LGHLAGSPQLTGSSHVAAVGADKKGHQELESKLLKGARIFVDDIRQCRTDGEIKVPLPVWGSRKR
jgi:alanine dehydrogenase